MTLPRIEQRLANLAMQATARSVSAALSDYQKWLVAGIGAATGLLLPKLHQMAQLIGETRTLAVVSLLLVAIVMAVVSLLVGAQVLASTSTNTELQEGAKALAEEGGGELDIRIVFAEMRRGLWWPARWGFDYGRRASERGDHAASGRLVARLSQCQMYLVAVQLLLTVSALFVVASAMV